MRRQPQHCPVARAVAVLAEPGTLLIVRELAFGSQRGIDIARGVPGMSSAMLSSRLKTLRDAGLVERLPGDAAGSRYRLTAAGRELRPLVDHLGRWGQRWTPPPRPGDLDPDLLLFDISRQADRERLPVRPVAVQIDFADGPPPHRWWLVLSRARAVARHTDPGIALSARVDCTLAALASVWLGYLPWLEAVDTRRLQVTGDRGAVPAVIGWLGVSRYADPLPVPHSARPVRSPNGRHHAASTVDQ